MLTTNRPEAQLAGYVVPFPWLRAEPWLPYLLGLDYNSAAAYA